MHTNNLICVVIKPPKGCRRHREGRESVYHSGDEFDMWWFIRVIFIKLHDKFECPIFEWCVCRTNDHCVPAEKGNVLVLVEQREWRGEGHTRS